MRHVNAPNGCAGFNYNGGYTGYNPNLPNGNVPLNGNGGLGNQFVDIFAKIGFIIVGGTFILCTFVGIGSLVLHEIRTVTTVHNLRNELAEAKNTNEQLQQNDCLLAKQNERRQTAAETTADSRESVPLLSNADPVFKNAGKAKTDDNYYDEVVPGGKAGDVTSNSSFSSTARSEEAKIETPRELPTITPNITPKRERPRTTPKPAQQASETTTAPTDTYKLEDGSTDVPPTELPVPFI